MIFEKKVQFYDDQTLTATFLTVLSLFAFLFKEEKKIEEEQKHWRFVFNLLR